MDGLSDVDLAALLCSRVCHDVISPVGAIANGLEVLADEDDEEMRKMAFELVRRSAEQASAKLQFCRLAFGAAGSAGSSLDVGEAGDIARLFVGDEKVQLDWTAPREARDKSQVRLLLNLMLIAMSAVPRGGRVVVGADGDRLTARAIGEGAKLPEKSQALLAGEIGGKDIDARLIQVYYALRLATAAGYRIETASEAGNVVVSAVPASAVDAQATP